MQSYDEIKSDLNAEQLFVYEYPSLKKKRNKPIKTQQKRTTGAKRG